jgi:hypothetical protein
VDLAAHRRTGAPAHRRTGAPAHRREPAGLVAARRFLYTIGSTPTAPFTVLQRFLMSLRHGALFGALLLLVGAAGARAQQDAPESIYATTQPLRVFLDCSGCNFDYIRQEIGFVDYVRERQDAHVHILVTQQGTSGGGRQYVLNFIGIREFAGLSDTLRYTSPNSDSDELRRRGLTRVLKLGLMRFVASTPTSEGIQISYAAPGEQRRRPVPVAGADPWNFWTFRIGFNGNTNGESSRRNQSVMGSVSANRTTQAWKANVRSNGRYSENRYTLSSGREVVNINRNWGVDGLLVRSIGGNMAAGVTSNVSSSIFSNHKLAVRVAPALEYSFFPYTESTRRQFLVQYSLGAAMLDYVEMTLYDKEQETLFHQSLNVSYGVQQPWGSGGVSVARSNYFHDASFSRLQFDGGMDINITRGLSINFSGNYSRISDQLSLPRRNASDEDVLVSRRQLETSYRYRASVGGSYRFGSIFNNVVNPRLAGGGSDFF